MCGIAGYFLKAASLDASEGDSRLRRMADSLAHRGPDGDGIWNEPAVGFAHRRLSILDLSDNARQPMSDESGRVHLTYNGEIYNFQELRATLEKRGARFRSTGDTEVLLKAYLEWGERTPEKLVGMFAFAVYDQRDESLFLARDRFGEKPLFYTVQDDAFLFASEIKALLTWPEFKRRTNGRALHRYLTFQHAPYPETAFEGVLSLPPATRLRIRRNNCATPPAPETYWCLERPPTPTARDPIEAAEDVRALLEQAVRRQRVSDVPLGVFLSGGLDSSAIAYSLRRMEAGTLRTITAGFEARANDERRYARIVADLVGADHSEYTFHNDVVDDVVALDSVLDEPFADPAIIPAMQMSKLAKRHVDVVLSGDGGDEALLGYSRYVGCKLAHMLDLIPGPIRRTLARAGSGYAVGPDTPRALRYAARLLSEMGREESARYASMISFFSDEDRPSLYADGMAAHGSEHIAEEIAAALAGDEPIASRAAAYDLRGYLPNVLMTKTDRAAMAFGLEVRCPFLDHELVEYCAGLPDSLRLPGTNSKAVLMEAMQGALPSEILVRDKAGLGVPLAHWLRTDLWELLTDSLSEETVKRRGLFNHAPIAAMLNELREGGSRPQYRLWALLRLERWQASWAAA
ncbi:asparagine synthase (glutamine-hydrolyzing) [Marivibrio halodurans]|uniref:asparagine synthase (glutamine-hydrolyzing) n=1 Tax=Marivibrio halodurans TaxID=2039722 RepID=A0A8J7V0T8_9PROT|nr:asparagine synthase (glutamine-hydrolyzing) [Marivibrio halodurans]MBP5855645.1 asparagine synthase (glutamine-hydrolyzing) [Marivibrio halodurans]